MQAERVPAGFERGGACQKANEAIYQACVAAWRKCIAGDQTGALKDLKELDRQYPKITTIQFMIGQVLEHAGKKKEALKYYQEAVSDSDVNSMYLLKLADARRTSGDCKNAIVEYKRLLEISPDFVSARLGLAKALKALDPKSIEATKQIREVLRLEPENKEALALLKDKSTQ